MYKIRTYNSLAAKGLDRFHSNQYQVGPELPGADALMLRSQKLQNEKIDESVVAVARAGAGVNNIPVDEYAKRGIVVFNTPGANANAVKELVAAALLLGSRDIYGGMSYVQTLAGLCRCKAGADVHNRTQTENRISCRLFSKGHLPV